MAKLFLTFACLAFLSAPAMASKNILILHSYDPDYFWTDRVGSGILDVLEMEDADFSVSIEYLNVRARSADPAERIPAFLKRAEERYSEVNFDIIVAVDQAAYRLMRRYRDKLFPNATLVFCGVEDPYPLMDNAVGIVEETFEEETFDLIKALIPDLDEITIVVREGEFRGDVVVDRFRKHMQTKNWHIKLRKIAVESLIKAESKTSLAPGSVVLYSPFFTPQQMDRQIINGKRIKDLKLKVFGLWDYYLYRFGIMGGVMASAEETGRKTARIILQIIKGGKVDEMEPLQVAPFAALSYPRLRQAGIGVDRVPEEVVLLDRPPALLRQFWKESVLFSLLFVISLGVIVLLVRINHKKKLTAEEYKLARDSAQAAFQAKSTFVGIVSHEFRTPLTAIIGFAEILSAKLRNAENLDLVRRLWKSSTHLRNLIDELLDISRLEAGQLDLSFEPVPLRSLVEDVVFMNDLQAKEYGVNVSTRVSPNAPTIIVTDEIRTKQILGNLLSNAIKFAKRSDVVLEATPIEESDKSIGVIFRVTDSGRGVAPEDHERIFEPFAQVDSSLARKRPGSGLGLYLSRKLAKALGGTVTLEKSALGEGSTFALSIKCETREVPECNRTNSNQLASSTTLNLNKKRVLVVDDAEDNQVLIEHFLNSAGAEVRLVSSGKEAIKCGQKNKFDLILMDIQMPGIDGFKATQSLRRLGYRHPIVALTAHTGAQQKSRCLEAGFDEFLSKPISREELLRTSSRLVSRGPRKIASPTHRL